MTLDLSGVPAKTDTREGQVDTSVMPIDLDAFNVDWHRNVIHPKPQHGCALCVPTPCACGYQGELCSDYFEHRGNEAGSETTWREAA